jgi:hypothetical protein
MGILDGFNNLMELQELFMVPGKIAFKWEDEDGNDLGYLSEDDPEPKLQSDGTYKGVKVKRIPVVINNRHAENESDFEYIFNREFKKNGANDPGKFRDFHYKKIEKKIEIMFFDHPNDWDYPIFGIAKKYIEFLRNKTNVVKDFGLKEGITDEIVTEYYKWLYNHGRVECNVDEFKIIFSNNKKLPRDFNPILWKGGKAELAAYIIKLLNVKQSKYWIEKTSLFFVDEKGLNIKAGLKQSRNKLDTYIPTEKMLSK